MKGAPLELAWERIYATKTHRQGTQASPHPPELVRAQVPSGWLVAVYDAKAVNDADAGGRWALTFVPDPEHTWQP